MRIETYTRTGHWGGWSYKTVMIKIIENGQRWGKIHYYPRGFRGDILKELFERMTWRKEDGRSNRSYIEPDYETGAIMKWLIEKRGRSPFQRKWIKQLPELPTEEIKKEVLPYVLADRIM